MALVVVAGLAFVILGYVMTQITGSTSRQSAESVRFWGYVSMAFFGPVALIGLWRMVTQRGTVITLAPEGLHDRRVTKSFVPWHAIDSIVTWQHARQRIMVLKVKRSEEEKLQLTPIAGMSRGVNAKLGADGLSITAQGTQISHDNLMAATIAYAERHGRSQN
ncbi:MAG: STM3941 family protein [Beijerinckiaceae bacterium]